MKRGFVKRLISGIIAFALAFTVLCSDVIIEHNIASAAVPENFAVDYDPNDGLIHYGHYGEVGMRVENDLNDPLPDDDSVVRFPADVINAKDEYGMPMFADYDPTDPYYDYSDMLNYTLGYAKEFDNAEIFIADGVYYFEKSIHLYTGSSINATAGKVAFVIKPYLKDVDGNDVEVNGFFTNHVLKDTYAWFTNACISDIVFVVEDTHPTFKPTSAVDTIMDNLFSDDIQAVDNFALFYRIRSKGAGFSNIAASGFQSFMRWTYTDMLTRVTNCSVGPTRIVFHGTQTNDAFFHDSYFYGGYYTKDGLHEIPIFQINFDMATTEFSNSYIGNYYFSRTGASAWCPYTTLSNLTLERVYNFTIDTTSKSSNTVSGCYFKDCAYNDIADYFNSLGLPEYDISRRYWDHATKWWVYPEPDTGWIIRNSIVGDSAHERKENSNHFGDEYITMIELHAGTCFVQNKIECDSLDWTTLVRITDSEWESRYTGARTKTNINFADNAFKINEYVKEDLFIDDWRGGKPLSDGWYDNTIIVWGEKGWNNDDGTPAMGYVPADGGKPVCWWEDYIYVSTDLERYMDFTAFKSPDAPTAGYAALGAVGADEEQLISWGIEDRYYHDKNSDSIEKVYLCEDFGAKSWHSSSSYLQLQEAFDYAATHDAILYIDPGTYYTDKPIILRGGATYRVVFEGTIEAKKSDYLTNQGLFVMSADDNAPIDGYFYQINLSLQSGNTSAFFNVNTDKFLFNLDCISRGIGCFTNCKINNSIIVDGAIQYCRYGFFYKTVTYNTVVKNVYGTASTWVEEEDGITPGDINYRYFISNSDFTHSTWRGCWLEFGQFSNGKKLTGEGNSVYRGNLIDYTYNYSFGKNDVVVGNTMSRASYSHITDHMTGSNFPIDLPDALTDTYMVMYHVSDGLRLIGNMDIGTMNEKTHFIEFDSPTIKYTDENGNEVISISNVRIAGNGVTTEPDGAYKVQRPCVPFGRADNIVLENCQNNVINIQNFYLKSQPDDPSTPDIDETVNITEDIIKSWSIPGVNAVTNYEPVTVEPPADEPEELERIEISQPPQDEIYDIPNKWEQGEASKTEYLLYDFRDKSPQEIQALLRKFESFIDTSTAVFFRKSDFTKFVTSSSNGQKQALSFSELMSLSSEEYKNAAMSAFDYGIEKSPAGNDSFYMNTEREVVAPFSENNLTGNKNKPTFSLIFRDDEICGESLQSVNVSLFRDMYLSYAWQGSRLMFITYAEDDDYYYGFILGYGNADRGVIINSAKLQKNYMSTLSDYAWVHYQTGVMYSNPYTIAMTDTLSGLSNYGLVCGDYTKTEIFEGDFTKYPDVITGVDLTLEYNDVYDTVTAYATFDFSYIGADTSVKPELVATTRDVWIGTFDLEGNDKIFGIGSSSKAWIESVMFEYVPQQENECNHSYVDTTVRDGSCTRRAVVRHTCTECGYAYITYQNACGHNFRDGTDPSNNKTLRTCIDCGLSFYTDTPIKYPPICGDINADTKVNLKDVVLLYQFTSRWKVPADSRASDTNGDGKVNIKDVVLLYQFVSNWRVELAE